MQLEPGELAKTIDHTLLAADARRAQIDRLCQEARTHGFMPRRNWPAARSRSARWWAFRSAPG